MFPPDKRKENKSALAFILTKPSDMEKPGRRGRRKTRSEVGMEVQDGTPLTPHYGRDYCLVSKDIYIFEKEDDKFYHFRLKTKEEILEDLLKVEEEK